MTEHAFDNVYGLSDDQLRRLDEAEEFMLRGEMERPRPSSSPCSKRRRMHPRVVQPRPHARRHLSEFERAVAYYNRVLDLEPDNAWARDARRRYLRYIE